MCFDVSLLKSSIPNRIIILEDCACATGAKINNKFAGSLGLIGVFSFHPRKIITTGEGGMITTNSTNLASMIKKLRNHGASISEEERQLGPKPYIMPEFNLLGYNYRMTDLQGSIGNTQLLKLKSLLESRKKMASFYIRELSNISWLELPFVPENSIHAWQAFVARVIPSKEYKRNNIMDKLFKKGISTRPGTHAIHMLNYYKKKYKLLPNDFPVSKDCHNNTITLPLHNHLFKEDLQFITNTIKNI